MRETTRRSICRVAFLVLCVGPTLTVLASAAYRHSPLFARRERAVWEQTLLGQLGLQAAIARVSYPRGGVTLLHDVTLTDPDSRRAVLRARLVELGQTERGLAVVLSQPEVPEGQFLRLWEAFHNRVLRGVLPATATQVCAAEVTLRESPRALTFTDVACAIVPGREFVQSALGFRVAGVEMQSPAEIRIVRHRGGEPPTTHWELQTGAAPLPCSLLAPYCPPLARLGADCRFQGTARAVQRATGWDADLAGLFHNIQLEHLIEPFPHRLTGTANLRLTQVAMRDGQLSAATGTLECRGGMISRSLLAEFAQAFHADLAPREPPDERPLVEYAQLAIGFQLDRQGLRISGLCDGPAPGVLLADPQGPLIVATRADPVPAMTLAQALAPGENLRVPATQETRLLLQALPLPPSSGPGERTAARPRYAPLRLRTP